jgi:deoxycytidine triphosphate deaminase
MILTDKQIKEYMKSKELVITNFVEKNLGPVSYDLTLANEVRVVYPKHNDTIDIRKPKKIGRNEKLPLTLERGQSLIFRTLESIEVPDFITGYVFARSGITKIPVLTDIPGLVDPGYKGNLSGVIYNFSGCNIHIFQMRICQIVFHKHEKVETSYDVRRLSKHQGQTSSDTLIAKTDKEFRT